ncbi:hypothetical protein B566_EDAN015659 [Ephemera danica]|nr:hypothetical protein B566_EDAN015659 [Ephemera danica]
MFTKFIFVLFYCLKNMPYKYIGRTTSFKGKTLWEIVGNLKNFGEGRVVVRNMFERYPEKSWFRILKVEPLANPEEPSLDNTRKVKAVVEKVWRGYKYEKPIEICRVSYKADYRLLSKSEEQEYCKLTAETASPLLKPAAIPFPPLLKELLQEGSKEAPLLKLKLRHHRDNRAKQDPNLVVKSQDFPVNQSLGQPKHLKFYENVLQ